jgi:hypothetical protein
VHREALLRYYDYIDGSPKSAVMTQGSIVVNLKKVSHVVNWAEQVETASLTEDGRMNLKT